jgi:thiamine biosynthesis lipoprotein
LRGPLLIGPALLLLSACSNGARLPQIELAGHTMGTTFNIVLVAPGEELQKDALQSDIVTTLDHIEDLASTWRDESELSSFNAAMTTDWQPVSVEFCNVLEQALSISATTGGAFDITVGPLVNLWGFGPDGEVMAPPGDAEIAAAKARVGFDKLETQCDKAAARKLAPDLYVDLSGWAKGYAVDRVAALLDEYELGRYLVEIGGEVRVRGHNAAGRKWAIAIEAPATDRRDVQSVVHVTDTGVATSGDYRNYFVYQGSNYSHTIDPRTGRPVDHNLAAVTVVDESAAYADAMATALLVLGPEDGPLLAEELGVAGYFLIRNPTGIRELTTSNFDLLSES